MDRRTPALAVIAGVITLACGGFAVAMAVTTEDDGATGTATDGSVPAEGAVAVVIADFAFDPNPVSVPVGGAVTWTNSDDLAHSVQSDDGVLGSPPIDEGQTYTATFDTAGEIAYYCGIHPSMTGTVTVTP